MPHIICFRMASDQILVSQNASRVAGATSVAYGQFAATSLSGRGLVAVAAGRCVCIYDPLSAEILACCTGHTGRVNAVAWIHKFGLSSLADGAHTGPIIADESEFVSASTDGSLRFWRLSGRMSQNALEWECTATGAGSAGTVTAVSTLDLGSDQIVAASVSADCTVRLWHRPNKSAPVTLAAIGQVKPASVLEAVALTVLPGYENCRIEAALQERGLLIAAGGADNRVHLFCMTHTQDSSSGAAGSSTPEPKVVQLQSLMTCPGHTDWIRSLSFSNHSRIAASCGAGFSFASTSANSAPYIMLASGAQDNKIRLWRIARVGVQYTEGAVTPSSSIVAATGIPDVNNAEDDDEECGDHGSEDALAGIDTKLATLASAYVPSNEAQHTGKEGEGQGSSMTAFEAMLLGLEAALQGEQGSEERVQDGGDTGAQSGGQPAGLVFYSALHRLRGFTVPLYSSAGLFTGCTSYEVVSDALLTGHDAWVTGVTWHPPVIVGGEGQGKMWQPPCLVTSSMDKSAILWQPTGITGGVVEAFSLDGTLPQRACGMLAPARLKIDCALWSGVWRAVTRVGGAGGNALGLYSAGLTGDGCTMVMHSYQGAMHAYTTPGREGGRGWARVVEHPAQFDIGSTGGEYNRWRPHAAATGHFGSITDLAWDPMGRYLVTVSLDFTTRVWAEVSLSSSDDSICHNRNVYQHLWREISRPQIHGYEGSAVALPGAHGFPHRIFAGADEKIIRMYDAPRSFIDTLNAALSDHENSKTTGQCEAEVDHVWPLRPVSSYLPELSLTNKAVAESHGASMRRPKDSYQLDGRDAIPLGSAGKGAVEGDEGEGEGLSARQGANKGSMEEFMESAPDRSGSHSLEQALPSLSTHQNWRAPLEEELVVLSRWPETGKLFGHANEIVALACNSNGSILASSCKARSEDTAVILLWDARTGRQLGGVAGSLRGHKLTVERLEFSHSPCSVRQLSVQPPGWKLSRLYGVMQCQSFGGPHTLDSACASEFLVSAGRDRQVGVFGLIPGVTAPAEVPPDYPTGALPHYAPAAQYEPLRLFTAHKRQLFAVSVAPLPVVLLDNAAQAQDAVCPRQALFATGARDGIVRFWSIVRLPGTDVPDLSSAGPSASTAPASVVRVVRQGKSAETDGAGEADGTAPLSFDTPMLLRRMPDGSALALRSEGSWTFPCAVTSLAFAPVTMVTGAEQACAWIAVGLESGSLGVLRGEFHAEARPAACSSSSSSSWLWNVAVQIPAALAHADTVRRVAWRPVSNKTAPAGPLEPGVDGKGSITLLLASAGAENALRITKVDLTLPGGA